MATFDLRRCVSSGSSHQWLSRQARDPYVEKSQAAGYRSRAAFKLLEIHERFKLFRPGDRVLDLGAAPGSWTQVAAELVAQKDSAKRSRGSAAASNSSSDAVGTDIKTELASGGVTAAPPKAARASIFGVHSAEVASVATNAATTKPDPTPSAGAAVCTPLVPPSASVVAVDLLPIEPLPGVKIIKGDFTTKAIQTAIAAALGQGDGTWNAGRADVLLSDMAHSFSGSGSLDHTLQMRLAWSALLFTRDRLRPGGHAVIKLRYGDEHKLFVEACRWLFKRVAEVKPPASRAESAEAYVVGLGFVHYDVAPPASAAVAASTSTAVAPVAPKRKAGAKEKAASKPASAPAGSAASSSRSPTSTMAVAPDGKAKAVAVNPVTQSQPAADVVTRWCDAWCAPGPVRDALQAHGLIQ